MKEVESQHPPGAVVLITGDTPRFHHLMVSLEALHAPAGSKLFTVQSCNPAYNSNKGVRLMLDNPDLQWLWIMGDDHCFEGDTLLKLLDTNLDAVVPLTPRRIYPHDSVLWKEFNPDEGLNSWYTWEEISEFDKPFPVAGAGSAGLLVKRHVFERMQAPWFRVGQFKSDELQEDLYFTWRCNRMGFTVHCDPSVLLGHCSYIAYYPYRKDGVLGVAGNANGHKFQVVAPGHTAVRA